MQPLALAQLCSKMSPSCQSRGPSRCWEVPSLVVGMLSPFTQVCSMKDNRTEGINPRDGFGSPDSKYSLVDVKGTGKDTVPWSPLPFLLGKVWSVAVQCVVSSSMGIYPSLAEGWAQAGSSLPPFFPAPCHPQTATVWLGLCPEGWHLMRGLHRTLSPTAKSTPEGGTFSQQPCYDYVG